MRLVLSIWLLVGCALLTTARIPVFRSDRALWMAALPSEKPRVLVNVAAALIQQRSWESGADYALQALALAERPQSAYERAAVHALVRKQLLWVSLSVPICDRPAYQPHC